MIGVYRHIGEALPEHRLETGAVRAGQPLLIRPRWERRRVDVGRLTRRLDREDVHLFIVVDSPHAVAAKLADA